MPLTQADIEQLKTYFVAKSGGVLNGGLKPDVTDTRNLGATDKRFNIIYAKTIIADAVSGGGGSTTEADTLDGFHASAVPNANTILPLNADGVFPTSVYAQALLTGGSRALVGNLSAGVGVTIDGIDLDLHDHSGAPGMGAQVSHLNLTDNDADVHPQYTQRAQDEIITGDWMFTHLLDRSAGWLFEPDQKRFRAVPFNMVFTATADSADFSMGENSEILMHVASGETDISVGLGNDTVRIDAMDALYRFWVGHSDPSLAPFSITKAGVMRAISGLIGGWTIGDGQLSAGSGSEATVISATNPAWRIWAGDENPELSSFRVSPAGEVWINNGRVGGVLQSQSYVLGQSGWSLDANGRAEFENILARGRLDSTVFSESKVSVVSGRVAITDGTVLSADCASTDTEITFDSAVFEADDIIQLQPSSERNEWMKVLSSAVDNGDGTYTYSVERALNGYAFSFFVGETALRKGSGNLPATTFPIGYPASVEKFHIGGSGYTAYGGFLTLEGSREYGPYFGVAVRHGGVYNQITDVARMGRLKGFLGITDEQYGLAVGDGQRYLKYTYFYGLELKTNGGKTYINDTGISSDKLAFIPTTAAPAYSDGFAKLWYDGVNHRLMARVKDGDFTKESVVSNFEQNFGDMLKSVYDANGDGIVDYATAVDWSGIQNKPLRLVNLFVGDTGSGGVEGIVPAPAAGDAAELKYLCANGTWRAPATVTVQEDSGLHLVDGNIILTAFTGDSGSGGAQGAVPAPAAGDAADGSFLSADGTWKVPAGSSTESAVDILSVQVFS